MKMISIKRKTKYESRYHPNMGKLNCRVTRVYKCFCGVPYKQVRAQRETYYGEIKELTDCKLER